MVRFAEECASAFTQVATTSQLDSALRRFSRQLGFDHFALSLEFRATRAIAPGILLHDYPEEWARVYVGFELAGRDPVRRACDKSFSGFCWDSLAAIVPMTRGDRQMLQVGKDCGIGNGFTVPRHLPGLARGTCTFAVAPDRKLPRELLTIAETVGAQALSCALRLDDAMRAAEFPALTERQRECVLWVARGKTATETAIILGIGTETVVQHLKTARERYQVHCKQSLIISALFDGLIGFSDLVRWRDPK